MASQTRIAVRRKLESCCNLCDTIEEHLRECGIKYGKGYESYQEGFLQLTNFTNVLKEMIAGFRMKI